MHMNTITRITYLPTNYLTKSMLIIPRDQQNELYSNCLIRFYEWFEPFSITRVSDVFRAIQREED